MTLSGFKGNGPSFGKRYFIYHAVSGTDVCLSKCWLCSCRTTPNQRERIQHRMLQP